MFDEEEEEARDRERERGGGGGGRKTETNHRERETDRKRQKARQRQGEAKRVPLVAQGCLPGEVPNLGRVDSRDSDVERHLCCSIVVSSRCHISEEEKEEEAEEMALSNFIIIFAGSESSDISLKNGIIRFRSYSV